MSFKKVVPALITDTKGSASSTPTRPDGGSVAQFKTNRVQLVASRLAQVQAAATDYRVCWVLLNRVGPAFVEGWRLDQDQPRAPPGGRWVHQIQRCCLRSLSSMAESAK